MTQYKLDLGGVPGGRSDGRWPSFLDGPHRLFFGINPNLYAGARARAVAAGLQRRFGLSGALLPLGNLHLSVFPVGGYDELTEDVVADALSIGDRIDAASFEFVLDHMISFKNNRQSPWVMTGRHGLDGFHALQRSISLLMMPGCKPLTTTPHMTMAYENQLVPTLRLDDLISFRVEEIVLIYSLFGSGRHEHLGAWPLHNQRP